MLKYKFSFVFVLMFLVSCAAVQTFQEAIGSGYIAIETLANQTALSSELSLEQKASIKTSLQEAKDHLDTAVVLYDMGAADPANNRLRLALNFLTLAEEVFRNVDS